MRCITRETVQTWADGEISGKARKKIEAHLLHCPICQELVKVREKERAQILGKLSKLNPEEIRLGEFRGDGNRMIHIVQVPLWRRMWSSSVRIPIPLATFFIIIFLGLCINSLGHWPRKDSGFQSSLLSGAKTTLFLSTADSTQAFDLAIDLTGYVPISKPNALFFKEAVK